MSAWIEIESTKEVVQEPYGSPSFAQDCGFSWWTDIEDLTTVVPSEGFVGGLGRFIMVDKLPAFKAVINRETPKDIENYATQQKLTKMIEYCIEHNERIICSI